MQKLSYYSVLKFRSHVLQNYIVGAINHQPNGRSFSRQDVIDWLPEDLKKRWKYESLRGQVSKVLSYLAKHRGLKRIGGLEGGTRQSDITLTSRGREVVAGFIWPVLFLLSGKSLTPQQEGAVQRVRNSLFSMARKSAELYYPHSSSSKIRKHSDYRRRLVEVLSESRTRLTNKDLAERLKLATHTISSHYLKPLIKGSKEIVFEFDGQVVVIEREKIKGVWYYRLK